MSFNDPSSKDTSNREDVLEWDTFNSQVSFEENVVLDNAIVNLYMKKTLWHLSKKMKVQKK